MKDKMKLTTQHKWRRPFFKRPEVILVIAYIVAAIVWEIGSSALIQNLTLETDTQNLMNRWKPWGFVVLSVFFLFFFTRIWVLRLKKSRELLYNYLGNSPTIHYELRSLDSGIRIDWVSPNCERIMGYSPEEVKAPGWWLRNIHPNDTQLAKKTILRSLEEDQFVYEYRFRHKQGHYVWVRDELRRTNRRPLSFQGSWTNISADYVDNSNGKAGELSEHGVLSGIALLNKHRKVISVDAPFTEISGLTEAQCVNSKLEELFTATDIDDLDSNFPCNQSILIVGRNAEKKRYSAVLTIREAVSGFSEEATS
ncbi:PAS domain-containing protein, partial [Idiomarina abyssalis]|uniref:PAS domain-containing protein n=1 Tax=Idiomarina abyssalis TaxID=86102 RepID=UPI00241C0103